MSNFARDFYLDPGITIKQEPGSDSSPMITSASVPIPSRRDMNDYRDFIFDIEVSSQSPLFMTNPNDQVQTPELYGGSTTWGNRIIHDDEMLKSEDSIQMDDDDIFQVDKADLIQGPTLAELNANDENLLGVGDLNFDDLLLPEEGTYITLERNYPYNAQINANNSLLNNNQNLTASSCPQQGLLFYKELDLVSTSNGYDQFTGTPVSTLSPGSPNSSSSSVVHSSPMHINSVKQKHSTLHELLMKRDTYNVSPERSILGQSVPSTRNASVTSPTIKMHRNQHHSSRLSSSAPTHLGLDQIWQRREPRKHLLSTGSLAEAGSTSSLSTGGILSPDIQDFSHDEYESDEDSDAHSEDYSTDNGDSDDDEDHAPGTKRASKKEKYFWQYNVQAKGPKGQRLVMKCKMENPHYLNQVTDPVFSPDCSVRGIKHSGKARKGDGNDLTPNARKLHNIGKELNKLSSIINDMTPVSELPFNVRPTSRKEKNKLASRACRLKKKAQHEANKIKLGGLETEHRRFLSGIAQIKHILSSRLNEPDPKLREEMMRNVDKIAKACYKTKIAGHTTEYVNKILERSKSGNTASTSAIDDL